MAWPTSADPSEPFDGPVGDDRLAESVGHRFADPGLLAEALAHRSWCAEHGAAKSNERLEFLGDAVLGLVVAEHTFRLHPQLSDGQLSKVRAAVVNTRALAAVARAVDLPSHLRLGKGEHASGGRSKDSILADTTEAVIGAVYLDGGLEAARRVILAVIAPRIEAAVGEPGESDHKSRLQELSVHLGRGVPEYRIEGFGPDHARRYLATVYVAGQRLGEGEGRSKKDAEQAAARAAGDVLALTNEPGADGAPERGGGNA
jgi:ribonuclease III